MQTAIAIASSPTPSVQAPSQSTLTGLDGNVQMQDALPAGLPTTNRIKINITKNVTNKIVINTSENTDKISSEVNSCDSPLPAGAESAGNVDASVADAPSATDESALRRTTPEPEPEIEFDIKASMRDVHFQRMTKVRNGMETSGLCSIM